MSQATHTYEEWQQIGVGVDYRDGAFIDGEFVQAQSGRTYACINPTSGEGLAEVAECGPEDVDCAVQAARKAFEGGGWSEAAPADRKAVMLRLAELIRENADELAVLETMDMGKTVEEAAGVDIPGAADLFQWYAETADKLLGEVAPTGMDDVALITREALGVVGAVTPWNEPLLLATWKAAPALIAGNSLVLKPAEQAPHSSLRLGELAIEAGLPRGVLNVVTGTGPSAGRAIGVHEDIDCIAFTGSTETGKRFMGYAAESNGKPVWLELGGKSPNLVFGDTDDLEHAADMAALGIFSNQGEICSANSRLLVDRSIRPELVELIVTRAEGITVGDPLDPATTMGPLVDEPAAERVMHYIAEGRRAGSIRTGGERVSVNGYDRSFVAPTVIEGIPNTHPVARDEIFGPVLTVLDFADEAEAIRLANETRYGLAASIWTSNLGRAHRLAKRLRAGTISINTMDALSPATPFGGFRQSGFGRDLSLHALDKYTGLKTTWISL